jgi:hypothetical protein
MNKGKEYEYRPSSTRGPRRLILSWRVNKLVCYFTRRMHYEPVLSLPREPPAFSARDFAN